MTRTSVKDQTTDTSMVLQHKLCTLFEPPQFVKNANHEQLCGNPAMLQGHMYAGVGKQFPCHTKAAVWMSSLFFGAQQEDLDANEAKFIRDRLMKSAQHYGIMGDVASLWEKMEKSSQQKSIPDEHFAYVWKVADYKERKYPLRNAREVKAASDWFGKHHDHFEFSDKHVIASKILKRANVLNAAVDNSELLHRCAGFGTCSVQATADTIMKRANMLHTTDPAVSAELTKMASSILDNPPNPASNTIRLKVATVLSQIDCEYGLKSMYDEGGLDRPEESLFVVTEKVAADFIDQHVTTTSGAVYEKTALSALDIGDLRDWMGDDMADACGGVMLDNCKLAEILPTLPRPDADMFDKMARAVGIPVFARQKTAAQNLSLSELQQLAALYEPVEDEAHLA